MQKPLMGCSVWGPPEPLQSVQGQASERSPWEAAASMGGGLLRRQAPPRQVLTAQRLPGAQGHVLSDGDKGGTLVHQTRGNAACEDHVWERSRAMSPQLALPRCQLPVTPRSPKGSAACSRLRRASSVCCNDPTLRSLPVSERKYPGDKDVHLLRCEMRCQLPRISLHSRVAFSSRALSRARSRVPDGFAGSLRLPSESE